MWRGGQSELTKNTWFQSKAEEAEREHFGGKRVWKCIRDMQHGCRGLMPSRVVTIVDENGEPCSSPSAQHQCWRRHFTTVLNVRSQYDTTAMDEVRQRKLTKILGRYPQYMRWPGRWES